MLDHGLRALTSTEDLDTALAASKGAPVAIFKHSTRCGVSAAALETLIHAVRALPAPVEVWVVAVPQQRALSNEVAARLGVRHESPQFIVLRDGRVDQHASHFRITQELVATLLAQEAVPA